MLYLDTVVDSQHSELTTDCSDFNKSQNGSAWPLKQQNTDSWGTQSQDYGLVSNLYIAKDYNQGLKKKKQQSFHH